VTSTHQLANSPTHQFDRILLVRLRQIGDVVFTTPAVAALRRQFPDAHLTYLVEPAAAPIVAGNPHLDEVVVAPRRGGVAGMLADVTLGWRLRRAHYDLAIDFHGGPRASLLTLMSGAPRRIGYDVAGRRWMYTDVVGRPRGLRRRHSVENQWDLLTALDVAAPTPAGNPVEMAVDRGAKTAVDERLAAAGVTPDEDLAVIHVSASSPFRRWPLPSFVDTVAALASRAGRRVIVTSGPSEREAANGIINDARGKLPAGDRHRVLTCGDFSLAELRALLERSAVYIGGDSGPLHLAATTRVPIVAIFGPTPSERSAPWRDPALPWESIEIDGLPCRPCDQRRCEPGDFRCLTRIDAPRVVAAAERLLAAHRRPASPARADSL
jgi:lipopolysaccharide heptosyltransferase II